MIENKTCKKVQKDLKLQYCANVMQTHFAKIQGCPVQEQLAKELHRLAGVPEGPCGISELQKFQAVLPGYQIKVMSIDPAHMLIFVGTTPSDKIIRIIKEDDNYEGVTRSRGSCPRVTSAMSAIGGTTLKITKIIPVSENGVHLVIKRIARISQKLNDRWVQGNSLHPLRLAVCVIDPSLVRTVTLTIFIVTVRTFHPFASPTKNVPTTLR